MQTFEAVVGKVFVLQAHVQLELYICVFTSIVITLQGNYIMLKSKSATPFIPHYVNVFNKTTGERKQLTPQVNPLLASLQTQFDIASALQDRVLTLTTRQTENYRNLQAVFA